MDMTISTLIAEKGKRTRDYPPQYVISLNSFSSFCLTSILSYIAVPRTSLFPISVSFWGTTISSAFFNQFFNMTSTIKTLLSRPSMDSNLLNPKDGNW
jgi:hypothetical protein